MGVKILFFRGVKSKLQWRWKEGGGGGGGAGKKLLNGMAIMDRFNLTPVNGSFVLQFLLKENKPKDSRRPKMIKLQQA